MTEREEFPGIGPEQRMELWMASLAGVPELAHEMQRLGLCPLDDPEEALGEARMFLPMLHAEVEEVGIGRVALVYHEAISRPKRFIEAVPRSGVPMGNPSSPLSQSKKAVRRARLCPGRQG